VSESPALATAGQVAAALIVLDRDGRLQVSSPAARGLLGYADGDALPPELLTLVHSDDRERVAALLTNLADRAGATRALSIRMRRRDGSWCGVHVTAAGLAGLPAAPALLLALSAFGQTSEPYRTEQAMLGARMRLAMVFEHLIDGIMVQDSAGHILYANRVAAQLCGFESTRALIAARPRDLAARIDLLDESGQPFPPELLPGRRVLRGEEVPPLTLGLRNRQTGTERWVSIASTPVDDALNQSQIVISVLHDVTDSRQVEEELRRAVALRDTFLAAASHELRTPLTSLQGYLEVTRRRLERQAPAESIAGGLEVAIRQVARLTRLVGELLDASRLTRGLFVIEPQPLDLGQFVRRAVEIERAAATSEHPITVLAPAAGPLVSADADRLEQVLANLIGNARKYSKPLSPIIVTVAESDGAAALAVRDEGIGIPAEDQPLIFEPFHRARNVDRGLTGFGLGLYVAHEIVRAHGGTLAVESRPSEGSVFTITLPLVPEA